MIECKKIICAVLGCAGLIFAGPGLLASEQAVTNPEAPIADPEGPAIDLHFFWSPKCPHCRRARPFIEMLARTHPWIQIHAYDVSESRDNAERFVELAGALGEKARSVPAFIFCDTMLVGFEDESSTGAALLEQLRACRRKPPAGQSQPRARTGDTVKVPVLNEIDPAQTSLPLITVMIAGLDAFNPCAFFVLLFLLSLLIHTASRARLLIIGGIFVAMSGLMYFVFMAAWLNAFLLFGSMTATTVIAGILAVIIGTLNAKDYFLLHQGPSLSMSDRSQSKLFRRMRKLLEQGSMPALIFSTLILAIAANSYELLCTAGFPMVYTRILTLRELGPAQYYAYLALYNLIYVLPLMLIVAGFAFTLGTRKLSEREGRVLKLLSGLLMVTLGGVLLIAPVLLDRISTSITIVAAAVVLTAVISKLSSPESSS